ncbi:MAG: hypothetical protein COX30_03225 [Candidatus Moranbacteria bacterium CG23_combo_of_CG06-09_8_20_14_all_39_10]|nr:MAG: hypothetical protein COX30_03225 [Candidatus Moranbacteria bacterium CG23_combo_of_CG06-09_8_20_14_all_39_10]
MTTSTSIGAMARIQSVITESDIIQQIVNVRDIRLAATYGSHYLFFHTYLSHYVKYPTAEFQRDIFRITEDESIKHAVIVAFRDSAKSTIVNLSYPIWSIIGKPQKKFVLILGQTQNQARRHLNNIKREFEGNAVLSRELGPFEEKDGEWGSVSLEIPKFGARITAASSEQSIRGIRHGEHRPDLIILDDVEDSNSAKTLEGRDKTYNWLMSEIIPAGDRDTKIMVIGNLLHEDSLLMRLKDNIEAGRMDGIYRAYPLINKSNEILWPGKFRNMEDVEEMHKMISSEVAWQREIMLRIIPDDGQVIQAEWIQLYDQLPEGKPNYIVVGVDLAISQKTTADCTAMVTGYVYGSGDNLKIYILPNPINEHLTFPETLERIRMVDSMYSHDTRYICVEDVAYQAAVIQQLKAEGIRTEGVKVNNYDKRAKLTSTSEYIFSGRVVFPRVGGEKLINQLVHFGVEKHDDLADAFAFVVLKVIDRNRLGGGCGVLISAPLGSW